MSFCQVPRDISTNYIPTIINKGPHQVPRINLDGFDHQFMLGRNEDYLPVVSQTYRETEGDSSHRRLGQSSGGGSYFKNQDLQRLQASSALHSSRTYTAQNFDQLLPSPMLSNGRLSGLNLESTQELRAFVTIDLAKINKDRQNQLKLALEDNLRDKETHVQEIQSSYLQQRGEYERVSKELDERGKELEGEISKKREQMIKLKKQAAQIDCEQQNNERRIKALDREGESQMVELENKLEQCKENLRNQESEAQILRYERQSIEQKIQLRKNVKIQQFDSKVLPLCEEREQIALNSELLSQNLKILQEIKFQNQNELTMIEEDLFASNKTKIDLIYQREEIEQYLEKTKIDNPDLKFISTMIPLDGSYQWDQLVQALVFERQRVLLLDLIRELQQYILGQSSNTTDNSVMQSDELEELQYMIEQRSILTPDAVEMIAIFAQTKMKLDLSSEVLKTKLNTVCDSIDSEYIQNQLADQEQLEKQMKDIDMRIKVITNRCQNELIPRQKALTISDSQMKQDIERVKINVENSERDLQEVDNEIENAKVVFEQTQEMNDFQEGNEDLQQKLNQISHQLNYFDEEIYQIQDDLDIYQQKKQSLMYNVQNQMNECTKLRENLVKRYQEVLDEIKKEKSFALQFEFKNPKVQELTRMVAQLKCDKESAYKRLKYIEAKLSNSSESIAHAKSVLDNHMLQIQQDQLHQKIHQSSVQNFKRVNHNSSIQEQSATIGANRKNTQQASIAPGRVQSFDLYEGSLSPREQQIARKDQANKLKTDLLPQRVNHQQSSSSVMGLVRESIPFSQINEVRGNRLHSNLIDPEDNRSKHQLMEAQPNEANIDSSKVLSQKHRQVIQAYLQNNDKSVSGNDMVKYKHESSQAFSTNEEMLRTSQLSSSQYRNTQMMNAGLTEKHIPIQSFITPREGCEDMMQYNHSHQISTLSQPTQYELAFCGNYDHNSSIGSTDSLCAPTSSFKKTQVSDYILAGRPTTVHNHHYSLQHQILHDSSNSHSTINYQNMQQPHSSSVFQQLLPSVRISLRQSHNNSIDSSSNKQQSSLSNTNHFKENIAPNTLISATSSNTLNMRKLSQATCMTQITNKPPAVPQSKMISSGSSHQFLLIENQNIEQQSIKKRASAGSSRSKQYSTIQESTSQQKGERLSQGPVVQTKMRLCQNSNNGKILAVGIVDLSRCNQSLLQKDIQFFESVKPLIEGAQFLCFTKIGNCQAKHIYLDFSLLRLFITPTNNSLNGDRREILMVENIMKTELPQSTLDMIKTTSKHHQEETQQSSRRFEFHMIIMNQNGLAERMQILAHTQEELRTWIIGLNALISNKNNLMRLSSLIKT